MTVIVNCIHHTNSAAIVTDFVDYGDSWEAKNSRSTTQQIHRPSWNAKGHDLVSITSHWYILNRISPVHTITPHLSYVLFSDILPGLPGGLSLLDFHLSFCSQVHWYNIAPERRLFFFTLQLIPLFLKKIVHKFYINIYVNTLSM